MPVFDRQIHVLYGVQRLNEAGTQLQTFYDPEESETLWCSIEDGGSETDFSDPFLQTTFRINITVRWGVKIAGWLPALMFLTIVGEPESAGRWRVQGRTLPLSGDRKRFLVIQCARTGAPITGI